jgi:hypothetical protein
MQFFSFRQILIKFYPNTLSLRRMTSSAIDIFSSEENFFLRSDLLNICIDTIKVSKLKFVFERKPDIKMFLSVIKYLFSYARKKIVFFNLF